MDFVDVSSVWTDGDGSGGPREFLVAEPLGRQVAGVLVLFHPFGFDPEAVLEGEPAGTRLIRDLAGFRGPASHLGMAVVAPRSRGRALPGISLGWREHLDATLRCATATAARLGVSPIVAGGLSMGGFDALTFAGTFPERVKAVWAVNPIVDLAAWHDDIASGRAHRALCDMGVDRLIAQEVGGVPRDAHADYLGRSPLGHVDGLARLSVRLVWSPDDTIIPRQGQVHAHRLAELLRAAGARVDEQVVTHAEAEQADPGRFAHETCDVWSNAGWSMEQLGSRREAGGVASLQSEPA